MRYNLQSLLIVTAVVPPLLAIAWWAWNAFGGLLLLPLIFGVPPLLWLLLPEFGPIIRWFIRD